MNKTEQLKYMVRVSCLTYNHVNYIKDAMNGFTMQETNFPYVCTIIDDASTDGEQEVINNYLQEHFDMEDKSVVRNEETDDYVLTFAQHKTNRNCYFAVFFLKYNHYMIKKPKDQYIKEWLNVKYIAFCEGDDYWTNPKKLEIQFDALEAHPECSYSATGFVVSTIGKEDKDLTIYSNNNELAFYGIDYFGRQWIGKTLTLLIRGECYNDYLKEAKKYKAPKDTYLLYHLLKQGFVAYIPQPMGVYNKNGQGIWNSRSTAEMISWDMNTFRELYLKNDKDVNVYGLYYIYIIRYLRCKELTNGKIKVWYEGIKEARCANDRIQITRSLLSNIKHIFYRHNYTV